MGTIRLSAIYPLTSTLSPTLTAALAGQGATADPDTGLVYQGNGRYYDPALGRPLQPIYNGIGDRVGQTVGATTTHFALDVAGGLPEVIQTNE